MLNLMITLPLGSTEEMFESFRQKIFYVVG